MRARGQHILNSVKCLQLDEPCLTQQDLQRRSLWFYVSQDHSSHGGHFHESVNE